MRPSVRRAGPIAALLLAVILLAGCGGKLSAADLRSQAGQICTNANRQTIRIPPPSSPKVTATFLQHGIDILNPQLSQLRGLQPGKAQAPDYDAALGGLSRQLGELARAARRLRRGADPENTLKSLQRRLAPQQATEDAHWRALGIPACLSR